MKSKKSVNEKKKKSLITDIIIFAVIMIAVIVLVLYKIVDNGGASDEVVLEINGEKITQAELNMHKDFVRNDAIAEYGEKNDELDKDDAKLEEYINNTAIDELVRFKIEQSLAKKFGIVEHTDFDSFLNDFEAENKKRADMIADGEVVYGAKKYTLRTYYGYVYSNIKLALLAELKERERDIFNPTDDAYKDFYNKNKDDYKAIDNYEFEYMVSGLEIQTIKINEETYKSLSKENPKLYEIAVNMNQGDTNTGIIDDKEYTLKCIKREDAGYRDFEKYKDEVIDNLQRELYEIYIDKLVENAKVKSNT